MKYLHELGKKSRETSSEWNDIVMTKSQLKNSNIRFPLSLEKKSDFHLSSLLRGLQDFKTATDGVKSSPETHKDVFFNNSLLFIFYYKFPFFSSFIA